MFALSQGTRRRVGLEVVLVRYRTTHGITLHFENLARFSIRARCMYLAWVDGCVGWCAGGARLEVDLPAYRKMQQIASQQHHPAGTSISGISCPRQAHDPAHYRIQAVCVFVRCMHTSRGQAEPVEGTADAHRILPPPFFFFSMQRKLNLFGAQGVS